MLALERHRIILEQLKANGVVSVNKLSAELKVTEETIRRDLEKLEKQQQLLRTHGGAVPLEGNMVDLSLDLRKNTNIEAKQRLAVEATKHIVPGDVIFLDASTTTFCMSKELKKMKNITIITNSIRVINELAGNDNIKVIAVGGKVSNNQSLVGSLAEENIEKSYFANKMFFSSKGVTLDAGILDSNEQECIIKQKMRKNTSTCFYLCDDSKIGKIGFIKLFSFSEINYFITNASLDEQWKSKFAEYNINLTEI